MHLFTDHIVFFAELDQFGHFDFKHTDFVALRQLLAFSQ